MEMQMENIEKKMEESMARMDNLHNNLENSRVDSDTKLELLKSEINRVRSDLKSDFDAIVIGLRSDFEKILESLKLEFEEKKNSLKLEFEGKLNNLKLDLEGRFTGFDDRLKSVETKFDENVDKKRFEDLCNDKLDTCKDQNQIDERVTSLFVSVVTWLVAGLATTNIVDALSRSRLTCVSFGFLLEEFLVGFILFFGLIISMKSVLLWDLSSRMCQLNKRDGVITTELEEWKDDAAVDNELMLKIERFLGRETFFDYGRFRLKRKIGVSIIVVVAAVCIGFGLQQLFASHHFLCESRSSASSPAQSPAISSAVSLVQAIGFPVPICFLCIVVHFYFCS